MSMKNSNDPRDLPACSAERSALRHHMSHYYSVVVIVIITIIISNGSRNTITAANKVKK
jgi:hypothetical protein